MSTEFLKEAAVEARRLSVEEKIVVVLRAELEGILVHCHGQQKVVAWCNIQQMNTNPIMTEIERFAQVRREQRDFLAPSLKAESRLFKFDVTKTRSNT